jgi:Zn-dependent metalloprotease
MKYFMKQTFKALSIMLALASCGRDKTVQSEAFRWPPSPSLKGQTLGSLKISTVVRQAVERNEKTGITLNTGSEHVTRSQNKIGAALVRDSYLTSIRNLKNEIVYVDAGATTIKVPRALEKHIEEIHSTKGVVLQKLRLQEPLLNDSKLVLEPRLELENGRLFWLVDFLERNDENFLQIEADENGTLLTIQKVGSEFVDGQAILFPKGPKESSLTEVLLRGLVGDGSLSGSKVTILSALGNQAFNLQNTFQYQTKDARFDEVQVYYYIDKAIQWFKQNTNIDLPFNLDVTVHVGGIEKPTNTAFYYSGNIRFGRGDGVTYRDIPRDPSIVTHETAHAYVESIGHLSYEYEGGSLNEGFADFYTAMILDNPNMGEAAYIPGPYRRTIDMTTRLQDKNGGVYHDSAIVSGLFWEVFKFLGKEKTVLFSIKTLSRLNADSKLEDLGTAALYALQEGFESFEVARIQEILRSRGYAL